MYEASLLNLRSDLMFVAEPKIDRVMGEARRARNQLDCLVAALLQ
jgi:hypothetical protein